MWAVLVPACLTQSDWRPERSAGKRHVGFSVMGNNTFPFVTGLVLGRVLLLHQPGHLSELGLNVGCRTKPTMICVCYESQAHAPGTIFCGLPSHLTRMHCGGCGNLRVTSQQIESMFTGGKVVVNVHSLQSQAEPRHFVFTSVIL